MTDTPPSKPIVAPPPLSTGPKYGLDRFHSPRRYGCAHHGCPGAASTLARAGDHEVLTSDGSTHSKTHNCCGGDHTTQTSAPEPQKD